MPGNRVSPINQMTSVNAEIDMPDYVDSFVPEDRERIFRFFALFSRWECALKKQANFRAEGGHKEAKADWDAFAKTVSVKLPTLDYPGYPEARQYLLDHSPRRLMYGGGWQPNPRREDKETEAQYFLRIIRDVRNNLFHGGKYQGGPMEELARDRQLIDSAIIVLQACIGLDPDIQSVFDEHP